MMSGRRHKLGGRLLTILLICELFAVGSLLGTVLFTLSDYTQDNSVAKAQGSTKALECKIQDREDASLRYAKTIADNAGLGQAIAASDAMAIAEIVQSAVQNS